MNVPEQPAPQTPSGEIPYWLRSLIGTPLALLGGLVTLFFAFSLCAYIADRIGGGRPAPNAIYLLFFWLIFGAFPLALGILLLRTISKRFWWRVLLGVLLLS